LELGPRLLWVFEPLLDLGPRRIPRTQRVVVDRRPALQFLVDEAEEHPLRTDHVPDDVSGLPVLARRLAFPAVARNSGDLVGEGVAQSSVALCDFTHERIFACRPRRPKTKSSPGSTASPT